MFGREPREDLNAVDCCNRGGHILFGGRDDDCDKGYNDNNRDSTDE
jgi:hypothetical protein